ncbi:MAG: hypothetical protein V4687_12725 [Bacteroidota bacterium]
MHKSIRICFIFVFLITITLDILAQDAVVISEGNFIRGTIKGTNFSSVVLKTENDALAEYKAKDIKEFLWNGETYVSKPILIKKDLEYRFFKVIALGAVNLYAIGGTGQVDEPVQKRAKFRPSFGIGAGTGGFGGVGMGGGISIGGGRGADNAAVKAAMPTTYFIEKVGTGPMQEVMVDKGNLEARTPVIKSILLQKLTNDEDLAERIRATEVFDAKLLVSFITAYNTMKK